MEKKSRSIWLVIGTLLALVLIALVAVVLLRGGGEADTREHAPKFGDMVYTRPDVDAFESNTRAAQEALSSKKSYRALSRCLDAALESNLDFQTMYTLAYIRSCQDLSDDNYTREYAWCDEQSSRVSRMLEELFYACAASPYAEKLEKDYFWEGFTEEYRDEDKKIYDEEMVAMLQVESALLARYRSLIASPTVEGPFGETDYDTYLQSLDEAEYVNGMMKYYYKYNEELARIFIDLCKVRRAMAEKLDYDSYEQMQYDYYWERDYSPEQAMAYVADIKQYIVPVYREARNTGIFYAYSDYPYLSEEELLQSLRAGASAIGDQAWETFSFMEEHDLFDLRLDLKKFDGSFQTYLNAYESPFLFVNANGDLQDLQTASHEFGHCVDAFVNYNAEESIDMSETFSQTMEYLMPGYLADALPAETREELAEMKMLDTLDLYVQQAAFTEFEHLVYATDPQELSAEFLNDLCFRLAEEYGYYDGYQQGYYAMSWMDVTHFFEMPFYVIAYPVSNDVALQIYELEREERGSGLQKYLEILPREGESFLEMVSDGGLQSPFAPGRAQKTAELLDAWLAQLEDAAAA